MNSLKRKLTSLINVNRRDSSIFTNFNQTHISISNYVNLNDLVSFFENDKKSLNVKIKMNLNLIKNELENAPDFSSFLNLINKYEIYISNAKKDLLEKNFNHENKKNVIDYAISYLENIKVKFISLQRKAKEIERDKGSWNLYLARYFIKGLTNNKKQAINAPIILYKIEIVENNSEIIIKKINHTNDLNEKLIVFLQRDNGKQKRSLSDFYTFSTIVENKNQLKNIVEKDIEIMQTNDFSFLNETSKMIEKNYDKLVIEDRVCLGIFEPSGGRLKDDLEQILEKGDETEIFDKPPTVSIEQIKQNEISSKPIIQIDELDLYQKCAVRSSLLDNTIVHGPPGTGKSEVIANVIANILLKNKDVLIVSEKAAALEVLNKRLKDLSIFMLLIYDTKDKKKFYDSLQTLFNYIGDSWQYENSTNSINKVTTFFNETYELVENFKQDLKNFNLFKDYKINNYSFNDFAILLNQFGGIELINEINNSDLIPKYKNVIEKMQWSEETFFCTLNEFINFCNINEKNSEQSFNNFFRKVNLIKRFYVNYDFNIQNYLKIKEDILLNCGKLSNYLKENKKYENVLMSDCFKFYQDIKIFKEIKSRNYGIINNNFFKDFNSKINLLKNFISVFNKAKKSHKKFILDAFKNKLQIVNKKPFSKLFYKRKLTKLDTNLFNDLNTLNNLNLDFYFDFNFIYENQELFNPLAVMHYFDDDIFNEKYYYFLNHNFDCFDFSFYQFQNKFKFDKTKWNQINEILILKSKFESVYPFFTKFLFQEKIDKFNQIDWELFVKALMVWTRYQIIEKIKNSPYPFKELLKKAIHVANLKRRPMIYEYLSKYEPILKIVFPIWVARPESVSLYVPLEKNYFEYGIYDEASQMFLERAYPLLYRSRINMVAGDDKQLKPSDFFTSREDEEDGEIDDLDQQESLLDRAKSSSWNELMLQNHYRSQSKELIEFSSNYIYDKRLNYASKNGNQNFKALNVINVNGNFVNNKNVEEAKYVIKLLKENINSYKSILVVTFNSVQSSYISSLLLNSKEVDSEIKDKYLAQEIEVVNLENVQGNEADLVIMSIGYGRKNDEQKIRATFGALIQDGGKNRLNVAITRAKLKMIILKSLFASDIKSSSNPNLMIFKEFLAYLDNIDFNRKKDEENNQKFNSAILDELNKKIFNEIYNVVYPHNLSLIPNYNVGNKTIDIAIVNSLTNTVVLGLLIEKWDLKINEFEKLKLLDNQKFLEARGYKILRIIEHEWNYNKKLVVETILEKIKSFIIYDN